MPGHTYKTIEITGSSPNSIDDSIRGAVRKAGQSLHGLRWFETTQIRGHIEDGEIAHWQVTMKLGFALDDNPVDD